MPSEIPRGSPHRDKATAVRPGQVVRTHAPARWTHEVRVEDERVFVTVECPDLDEDSLRYAVGSRYVVVWSRSLPKPKQQLILLPVRVDPKDHVTAYRNGLFDVSVRRARPRE